MKMDDVISLCVVYLVLLTREAVNGEQCHCAKLVHLQNGKQGTIPCQCTEYRHVAWYTEKEYDLVGSPFITFNNIESRTTGSQAGEYDVTLNGSLIIKNVTLSSHHNYVVEFTFNVGTPSYTSRPRIIVVVSPVPVYPVVNGYVNKQYVHMFVERWGTLHCSMAGVHPRVNLTWSVVDPSQSDKISFQHDDMNTSQNEDGTFYVSSTSTYRAQLSIQSSVVQCQVANGISSYFPAITTVELRFPPSHFALAVPVIDGCYSQQNHCVQEVGDTGKLTCTVMDSLHPVVLKWNLLGVDPSKLIFEDQIHNYQNNSKYFNASITTSYMAEDESLTMVTVQCVLESAGDDHVSHAVVSLVLSKAGESLNCAEIRITKAVLAMVIVLSSLILTAIVAGSGTPNTESWREKFRTRKLAECEVYHVMEQNLTPLVSRDRGWKDMFRNTVRAIIIV
ncbi:hypothetical protein HOLleu_04117 [Holothuria leucospilota]|uniref:Ig-like domain-containing protein n=1 Tax=Holothuria leucospilota TaxID=206669 RepID=A0A9Q1CSW7_HOLLE|nr:hypothetical protein HOLleu_04117 [Holothuria leucospilota]